MLKNIIVVGIFTYYFFLSSLFAKDTIIVSIPPQKYFIEQLAKENFKVVAMMDDTVQSEFYNPTSAQYIWAEDAVAYLKTGMYNENKWIKKIKVNNHKLKVFDTTLNTKKYEGDIYIWLDPMQVRIQVKNILNALIQLDKKNEKFYKKNYFLFVNRISRIDYQIKTMMKKHKRNYFIVFNPTWGYFARRYNLKQLDIVANPLDSSDQNVMDIINKIRRLSSNILFIPKYYFPKRLYKQLSEKTKIILAPVSYLDYDWENNLLNISRMIEHQKN